MKIAVYFLILIFISCSTNSPRSAKVGVTVYSFTDISGTFKLVRENKIAENRLITRSVISDSSSYRVLEKSIIVSQLGTVKTKNGRVATLRPLGSEFTVWLEGKKYSSRMKLDTKTKSMLVNLESPEERWRGEREISFPKGQFFCFYSQLSECLYQNNFLEASLREKKRKFNFFVVWDSWPFVQDQLTGIGQNLFARASLKFDSKNKSGLRYIVEIDGQIVLYHFSKSYDLVKIAWVAQGITVVPPGEEQLHEDQ